MGRPKGVKDKTPRKKRTDNLNPAYASHGNIKHMVEKNEKKEDISRIVHESCQYLGRKKPQNNQEFAERLNQYFAECCEKGQIPTVEDMALALGSNRRQLYDWEHYDKTNRERAEMITQAKEILAAIDAKLVSEGKIPQVTYIFRAKNYFGMKDQTQISWETTPVNSDDDLDEERLRQKYLNRGYEEQITIEAAPKPELLPAKSDVIDI